MKNKIALGVLFFSLMLGLNMVLATRVNAQKRAENDLAVTLKISSDKKTYIQGEAVNLTFETTNETDKAIRLYDVASGFLKVQIAYDGKRFNQYKNTSTSEGGGKYVKPGESFVSQAKVLWNLNPIGSYANVESFVNSEEGAILSDYAFPEAGVYSVKAVLSIRNERVPGTLTKIESAPIQIVVEKPVGDDLAVWNRIKDNKEIAYFMHRGYFSGMKAHLITDDKDLLKVLKEIELIVQSYPNSFLAAQLKPNLEKFYANENLRKLYLEKRKQSN